MMITLRKQTTMLWLTALLLLLTAACTPAGSEPAAPGEDAPQPDPTTPAEPPAGENPLDGSSWMLAALDGTPFPGGLTLEFSADSFGGSDGCNSFSGGYTVAGDRLQGLENFAVTERACLEEGVMERAQQYIAALMGASTFTLADGQLTIATAAGDLLFVPQNVQTLYVAPDAAECVGEGPQSCLLVRQDPAAEYTFFYDSIAGFTWEPGFQYELRVNVSDVVNPPAGGSALRYQLVEVVSQEAVAVEPVDITGVNWALLETVVGGDAVVPAPDFANPFFIINDGTVSGSSGCNSFTGSVTLQGNTISFGPLATTRMMCPEAQMTLEQTLLEIFSRATTVTRDGDILTLADADGLPLARFAAAEQKTLFVGPEQVECVGVGPQECLLVREDPTADYTLFYDSIAGFEWEPGYVYELLVSVTTVTEPLADASSLQYKLVEIVSQEAAAPEALTGTVWQWVLFEDTAGLNDIEVGDPAAYTLTFNADGSYAIQADCNSGGGEFTATGGGITILPGPLTMAACGEGSLDGDFLRLLGDVATYVFDDAGRLVLNLKLDAGNMVFAPAE